MCARIATPDWARAAEACNRAQVLSDLLALHIAQETGAGLELADHYSGQPYLWSAASGRWASVGKDQEPGTDDDITLGLCAPE